MNARQRSRSIDVPNLYEYEAGKRYRYRHPHTGVFWSLGNDRDKAVEAAEQLNIKLGCVPKTIDELCSQIIESTNTLHEPAKKINSEDDPPEQASDFSSIVDAYETEWLPDKRLKPTTLEIVSYQLKRFRADLGNKQVTDITTRFVSEYLNKNFTRNAYIKHRVRLIDILDYAVSRGLINDNPATRTQAKNNVSKHRKPLTFTQYQSIKAIAPHWLQCAMELSLITLQARNEIVGMQYADISEGVLHVIRQKTRDMTHKAYLAIEISDSLDRLIKSIRNEQASPYIIHEAPQRHNRSQVKTHWTQVLPDRLSKQFSKYRDETGLFNHLDNQEKPTFHEIRALGGHLYLQQGYSKEYVNALMGHTTMAMTEDYTDRHQRWQAVHAELVVDGNQSD